MLSVPYPSTPVYRSAGLLDLFCYALAHPEHSAQ
jgi:hypothetical protein